MFICMRMCLCTNYNYNFSHFISLFPLVPPTAMKKALNEL